MMKLFTKNIQDFECENCGKTVTGNGYTNHCPKCLCSKHVDINPGDRQADCQGLMTVVNIELKGDQYILTHKCKKCGFSRRNKAAPEDMPAIIEWSKRHCF